MHTAVGLRSGYACAEPFSVGETQQAHLTVTHHAASTFCSGQTSRRACERIACTLDSALPCGYSRIPACCRRCHIRYVYSESFKQITRITRKKTAPVLFSQTKREWDYGWDLAETWFPVTSHPAATSSAGIRGE